MMATRSVSTASTTFVAKNATTTRLMLKYPTEVFEAVVNDDDLKPPARRTVLPPAPLPLDWTQLGKSPANFSDVFEV